MPNKPSIEEIVEYLIPKHSIMAEDFFRDDTCTPTNDDFDKWRKRVTDYYRQRHIIMRSDVLADPEIMLVRDAVFTEVIARAAHSPFLLDLVWGVCLEAGARENLRGGKWLVTKTHNATGVVGKLIREVLSSKNKAVLLAYYGPKTQSEPAQLQDCVGLCVRSVLVGYNAEPLLVDIMTR